MRPGSRGATGLPPLPPDWLPASRLPVVELSPDDRLVRVHRVEHHPVFFSPGEGKPPLGRFDSPTKAFGVLYLARSFQGAFVETVLRNPQRRLVDLTEITGRAMSVLRLGRVARLVDLHGAGLQAVGTDNAVSTGPYAASGAWADALYHHPDQPDGIAYASRHDPDQHCIALFSRPSLELAVLGEPIALKDMLDEVAELLRRYGKGLA